MANTKKNSKGKKTLIKAAVAICIAGVLTITAGIGSAVNGKWFKNSDIATWFNSWGKGKQQVEHPENPEPGTTSGVGGLMVSNAEGKGGLSLLSAEIPVKAYAANGISPQAESAYTLTATIKPATADDKRVEWTVTGTGINATDYVTLTANGLTATSTCKQAFDKQLTVTVKSLDNPEAKATCTLDYVERITGVTVNMPSLDSQEGVLTYSTTSSKYTIAANKTVTVNNFQFNSQFIDNFVCYPEGGGSINGDNADVFRWLHPTYTSELVQYTNNSVKFLNASSVSGVLTDDNLGYCTDVVDGIIGCFLSYSGQTLDMEGGNEGDIISAFRDSCDNPIGTVDLTVSSTYGGKTYSSITETVSVTIDGSSLHISVSALSLDKSSIIV